MIPVPLMLTLALLSATAPFATDMYLPVLPHIAGEFGVEQAVAQFTLTGFFVGMAFGQLLIGPVSDVVGRRRLLLWSAGLALVASVLAALAPGIGVLILARILQGLGGGACNVLARSVVPDLLSGSAAAKTFSVLMAIGGIAPAIAPVIGGLLAEPVGWRGIFWTLTGLHAVQLLLAFLLVPETGGKAERTGGLVRTVAGNYLTVVRMPLVWGFLLAMAFGFGALFSYISASSFVLQTVYGFSPAHYSLLFAINALGMLVATTINSRLVTRFGAVTMLRAGLLLCVGGGLILTVAALADAPWYLIVACILLATSPVGFIMGNATALATGIRRELAGSISAVMGFVQSLLGGIVSPLMGLGSQPTHTMAFGILTCGIIAAAAGFWATSRLAREAG
ncbi:drug resistance transporter, Bcr/CflA subfamily [Corynebacterium sp. CMW7794]|uniref:multidrug effflux MFS transporter n=1 Tax=unclassified Corynebacterium TaxID=2624378 RepID=UPI000795DA53|nr:MULTISPECIES: multidrug effflux MFS transporter [unclassified Corynebacterium]KXB52272.1 drug resistance transporter, Bcr/CflA subfamily [Corynebacterium sp. DNF00584]KXI16319.1 drug resistance transporter, Bcr/CflA subfamily [Corynebacterium sp. CMW7794]OFN39364.1 Bcr/CflA family drug resistance efflux transporter [Corynebacterium sp. HMSC072G08]